MNKHKNTQHKGYYYFIASLIHCFIIASCAQISAPTGGQQDKTAPEIRFTNPANYSTNFTEKNIKIEFNEWIQPLSNPKNQVIISPDPEVFPKIEIARNELSIHFKETLQPNTTYSIFFGDNIKDNNEGNPFPNFKYIFSTGTFIDSLKLSGTLTSSMDKIPDNTFLLLYKEKEDSVFTQKRPFYITKVQPDGRFSMENVKEGDYKLFALNDKNGNYYYDLPTEAIAFTDSLTPIHGNLDSLSLELFMPEENTLRILEFDRSIKGGILQLTLNKELSFTKDEITVEILELKEVQPIAFQRKEAKKLTIYLPKLEKDSNSLTLIIKNNQQLVDTLRIKTESKNYKMPVSFFNDSTNYKTLNIFETQSLKLSADYYCLSEIDTSKIILRDTSNSSIRFNISRSEDLLTYYINAAWKANMKYSLEVQDSALVDLVGNYNKKQEISFLALSDKKAGNLLINYNLPQKNTNYIAILKDNSGKVLDKQILRDSQRVQIRYGLMPAGNYTVEVIEDRNQNGIWNSGNFYTKTLPEKIYKEIKPIIIKENWEAEENILVDFSKNLNPGKINSGMSTEDVKSDRKGFQIKEKPKDFLKK